MRNWINPQILVPAFFSMVTIGGTVIATWSNGSINAAMRDRDIAEFKRDNGEFKQALTDIKNSLTPIPLYGQRLAQLEVWQLEQKNANNDAGIRISSIKEDLRGVTTELANIRTRVK